MGNEDNQVTSAVQVYSADVVLPVTSPRLKDGAVAVRGDKILHCGDRKWLLGHLQDAGIKYTETHFAGALTPGLVNAHTHLQYTHMAELGQGQFNGFHDWGRAFDRVYDAGGHDWFAAAADGAKLSKAAGVTAAADVVTDAAAVSALHDAGLKGIAYWEIYGQSDWGAKRRGELLERLAQLPAEPGAGVSPHAPYSLNTEQLLDIPDIARERGLRLHIHLAESEEEQSLDEHTDGWEDHAPESFNHLPVGYGISSIQFVDHLGVLGPECHIAHGVYANEKDRAILRARGSAVALCPRSNAVIGLDEAPVSAYLREGNLIAVGTDSLSSSPSLDLLADVAAAYRIAVRQGYTETDLHQKLFNAATLGGATALGLQVGLGRIGQLAVGAAADLAFFEVPSADPRDALACLVEDGAGRCRQTVIAGQVCY